MILAFVYAVLISLSIVLGALSYYCIENPIRKILTSNNRIFVFLLIIIPLAVVFSFAKSIRDNKGFIDRVPKDAFAVFDQANNKFHELDKCQKKRKSQDCIYGIGDLGIIVIGDSHAMSIVGSIVRSLENNTVLDWSHSGCPTIDGVKYTGKKPDRCDKFLAPRLARVSDYAGVPIIVANRYSVNYFAIIVYVSKNSHFNTSIFFYNAAHERYFNREFTCV